MSLPITERSTSEMKGTDLFYTVVRDSEGEYGDPFYVRLASLAAYLGYAEFPGDVVGPSSSTDNAVARYHAATGKVIQNSVVIITDAGAVSGVTSLAMIGALTGGTTGAFSGAVTMDDLYLYDTNASHTLLIHWNEDEAGANRTLNWVMGGADRTITLSGDPTLGDWFDQPVKQASNVTFGTIGCGAITGSAGATFVSNVHINSDEVVSTTLLTLESDINNNNEYNEILFKVTGGQNYGAIRSYVGASAGDSYMAFLTTTDGGTLVGQLVIQHNGAIMMASTLGCGAITSTGFVHGARLQTAQDIGTAADNDAIQITGVGAVQINGALTATGSTTTDDLYLYDTNASHTLLFHWNEDEAGANRTLNWVIGGADRSLTFEGDAIISQDYSTDGIVLFGRLGLGAASLAGVPLHVFGNEIRFTDDGAMFSFYGNDNARNAYIQVNEGGAMNIWQQQNQAMVFRTNNIDRVTIAAGGGFFLKELADADADIAAWGQFWVHDDVPNTAKFTDDAGSDFNLVGWSLIAETTVGAGGAASIDFQNIPATYTHLMIVGSLRSERAASSNDVPTIRFNNDAGNNYIRQFFFIQGDVAPPGPATDRAVADIYLGYCEASTSQADVFSQTDVLISNYANINMDAELASRTFIIQDASADTSMFQNEDRGHWNNTAAVDRITVLMASAADIAEHSKLSLYGIK